jgi:hypothetical protein
VISTRAACCALVLLSTLRAVERPTAESISTALSGVTLDPERTYRVRELNLARADIKIYLTEGVLSFAIPVAGRRVAAVFTTTGVEAGDAEVLLLPPQRSERASIASFIKTPNLDEHFNSAVFLFSDDTANELLSRIEAAPVRKAPELAPQLEVALRDPLRSVISDVKLRLVEALLDNHEPSQGFFYGLIGGQSLGTFDILYDPREFEPILAGRVVPGTNGEPRFQLWTSFRPRRAPPYVSPPPKISEYRIDAQIHPDLTMSVNAAFHLATNREDGRAIPLGLSDRLKVSSATLDGKPVEIFQREPATAADPGKTGTLLLIPDTAPEPDSLHDIDIRYEGSVIRQTIDGSYFVDERNVWYPYSNPTHSKFDLIFHCPEQLRLVSTGEPVSDEVVGGVRTVHRQTQMPEGLAGFNLGDYKQSAEEHGLYRVECYANKPAGAGLGNIAQETENLLDYYTQRWTKLPIHSLCVSPIPGYFGQGFPGLVYLSTLSYLRPEERPARLRGQPLDTFFSAMLLAHEVAHQWWGNIVIPADYRTGWLVEAMANYSALQFLEKQAGRAAADAVLDRYRGELTEEKNGKLVDAAGPVDFGQRLIEAASPDIWRAIIYEKGTWILRMLEQRMGEDGFNKMQVRLLEEFAAKPVTNEEFRKVASEFIPAGQPDRTLATFFDTWVYGTGIPKLTLTQAGRAATLDVSQVDEDFIADVPLRCSSGASKSTTWMRVSSGANNLELPKASGSCELPGADTYLFSPH